MSNRQIHLEIDSKLLIKSAKAVAKAEGISQGEVSLAVVDDATIHELNRRFLKHDYPTDVLSFLLSDNADGIEGELVVSAETAARAAAEYDWPAMHELTLYVVHGMLHLAGFDDQTSDQRRQMREKECRHLKALGIIPPQDHSTADLSSEQPSSVGETQSLEGVKK